MTSFVLLGLIITSQADHYHFSCEYITSDTIGRISSSKMVDGELEAESHKQTWKSVTITNEPGIATAQEFMEGFTYDPSDEGALLSPEGFKGFPPMAMEARNLVWDTMMFEQFASAGKGLEPGVSKPFASGEVALAGAGTFTNTDIQLTGVGSATLKGHQCSVMKYDAFFNKIEMEIPGMQMVGRSHYWGEIWVDAVSGKIVLATLYEDVLAELTLGDSETSQTINVLRKGRLELK